MKKVRLDQALVQRQLVATRSQAEHYIHLGYVQVAGKIVKKAGYFVSPGAEIKLSVSQQYVSRAALKLASVARELKLNFKDKIVLDVGSSTGGFTDYALKRGAKKIIAVDVGSGQLHPSLRSEPRVELHEKTDIRDFKDLKSPPDIVLIDVSFISLREVLPAVAKLTSAKTEIVAMVKPQFEASKNEINKGVVKNDTVRRSILKGFEAWATGKFVIKAKADSQIAGSRGNLERFFLLHLKP